MRLQKRRSDEHLEINLVSLVDVVLLLLIFFVLTTSFVRQSQLAIHLPEAAATAPLNASAPALEVTVTERGGFFVNGRPLVDNRPETLAAAIRQVIADSSPHEATINADARAMHQDVVTAMDVIGRLGITEIHIATIRPRSD